MTNAFLNGEFLDSSNATISVLDRGFLFGDAIYEVIPVFNKQMLGGTWHLERLNRSLASVAISNPYSDEQWLSYLNQFINSTELSEFCIYIQISRGTQATRDYSLPQQITPTVFMLITDMPAKADHSKGISAITVTDMRWQSCHIKATTLLPNVLAKHDAALAEVKEAIYIRDGLALEGSSSNLFIVKDNRIITPPLLGNILPGITRKITLKVMDDAGVAYTQRNITEEELLTADEVWLTSSTQDVIPVTSINQKPVGNGKVGSVWQQVNKLYQTYKYQQCETAVEMIND